MSQPTEEEINILREAGYTKQDIEEYLAYKQFDSKTVENKLCICKNTKEDECSNIYNFKLLPNLESISFKKENNYTNLLLNNKRIEITTPKIFLPFGIDKYYNHWSLNMELHNKKCEGNEEFLKYLEDLENLICKTLNIDKKKLNSQIGNNKGVPSIYARIQSYNNRPRCKLLGTREYSNAKEQLNIYRFPKEVYIKAKLRIGNLWIVNEMICYKFNAIEVKIVN